MKSTGRTGRPGNEAGKHASGRTGTVGNRDGKKPGKTPQRTAGHKEVKLRMKQPMIHLSGGTAPDYRKGG